MWQRHLHTSSQAKRSYLALEDIQPGFQGTPVLSGYFFTQAHECKAFLQEACKLRRQ